MSFNIRDFENAINNFKLPNSDFENASRDLAEKIATSPLSNPAKWAFSQIQQLIKDFEATLDNEQEIGLKIVSLGNVGIYYVLSIECRSPYLLIFHCTSKDGLPSTIIQHHSQLNFILTVLPKLNPHNPPNRIGFVYSDETSNSTS